MRVALLDDYLGVSKTLADWSALEKTCRIDVFSHHLGSVEETAAALADYDVIGMIRERTDAPAELLRRLPKLKLLCITGKEHRTLDLDEATGRGILVCNTPRRSKAGHATAELAWGLIHALARHIPAEVERMRHGGWQTTLGTTLGGKTLGIVGLGRLGGIMAPVARAFGMDVIAWSQNLTGERAAEVGATRVDKDELFARADVVTLHLVLSERTRGIVGRREIGLMKPEAFLVNTSRGPLVDEAALVEALEAGRLAGAAVDTFDVEPLPDDAPIRRVPNMILTPHLGYTVREMMQGFYVDTAANIEAWLAGRPINVVNPDALAAQRGTP